MRELDAALLDGAVDCAVHSAKDVPARAAGRASPSPPCRRAPTRATRCAARRSLAALARGARVGTSSLRRAAQLRALRDDLEVVELRGNVDTRLRKLARRRLRRDRAGRRRAASAWAAATRARRSTSSSPPPARAAWP